VGSKDRLALRSIGFFFFTSGFFARRRAALSRARDPVRRDMASPLGCGTKHAPYPSLLPGTIRTPPRRRITEQSAFSHSQD